MKWNVKRKYNTLNERKVQRKKFKNEMTKRVYTDKTNEVNVR